MRLSAVGTGQVFQPADGRLRAQIGAAFGQPPDRHLEGRVAAQRVAVIAVGIARRDQQGAVADHLGQRMPHPVRLTRVFEAIGQPLGDPKPLLDGRQQQYPGIRGQPPAVESDMHRLARRPLANPAESPYLPSWRARTPLPSDDPASATKSYTNPTAYAAPASLLMRSDELSGLGSVEIWLFSIRMPCFKLAMDRFVLTEAQWARMEPHCRGKQSDPGRSGADNRRFVEAVLWIARTGSPWRDLPAFFGRWNTVFKRYRDWVKADIFKRLFDAASDEPDMEYAMVDATIVKVHRHGQGAKGGLRARPSAAPRAA